MKIRRRAVGGRRGAAGGAVEAGGARRLYLGHPGRHPPRSIVEPARAVLPSLSLADGYLTCLAYWPTDINYFPNRPLYELFRQSLEYPILFNRGDDPAST